MVATKHPQKCPCCNNPWANGEFFAKLCQDCTTTQPQGEGISRDNMDFDVLPKDNFYTYTNGTWLKNNPIPAGYPNFNSFLQLHIQSQENLKGILEELDKKSDGDVTEDERKVAAFYSAAMNEDEVEKVGITPLKPVLDLCDQIVAASKADGSKAEYAKLLGQLAFQYGINPFFAIGVSPDNENTEISITQISQGGLGLPDRDYYFDEDKQDKRDAYKKCIAMFLTLLKDQAAKEPTEEDTALAIKVYELEYSLAEKHMTKTENRDPHATYNKMSIPKLMEKCGNGCFDFGAYLEACTGKTVAGLGDINLRNVDALQRVAEATTSVDEETLLAYLQWRTLGSCASYLSKVFVDEHFNFYEKCLMGTQEIKPRWKRAMAFTESALGECLGKIYCAKYFDESSKERALDIVERVRQALEDRLKEVDWMKAASTRKEALKKMGKFGVKIGYPDKWIDYSTLKVEKGDPFLAMVFKARQFDNEQDNKEMNAPTDKLKWFMHPQQVNAYYHPNLNEIVFPAAILQPPFFNKDADDAVNFGAMGAVVGHEMTHAFDDKGRKFNYAGTLTDWWTADDAKEYEQRKDVMVQQANSYDVHGQKVQGELTCGENIADLGGLRLALRALKGKEGFDSTPLIDGFSATQRFFMSWSQCWRQNITKERSLQLLTIDPHGPNEMRCNGPLSNMSEFHEAFEVADGDPMYRPVESRVDIW